MLLEVQPLQGGRNHNAKLKAIVIILTSNNLTFEMASQFSSKDIKELKINWIKYAR